LKITIKQNDVTVFRALYLIDVTT